MSDLKVSLQNLYYRIKVKTIKYITERKFAEKKQTLHEITL